MQPLIENQNPLLLHSKYGAEIHFILVFRSSDITDLTARKPIIRNIDN
jgi:hypothetical protein